MNRHPFDATAVIFGLLFALSGFAIIADEVWPDIDTTAVVGAVVGALGLLFIGVLVMRQLREGSQPPPATSSTDDSVTDDPLVISE